MASYTSNYNLKKPASTDFINVQDLNDNADLIDTAILAEKTAVQTWAKDTFSNSNLLINGDFQVWQRGTDITSAVASQYITDRWAISQTDIRGVRATNTSPAPCNYSAIFTNASALEQHLYVYQAIENHTKFEGKPMTLSGWIRGVGGFTGVYYAKIGATGYGQFGLTSEWQYFTIETSNATFSTTVRERGVLFYSGTINYPLNGQGIELAGVKLELGSVATPFVPRPYSEELALCQRYYIAFGLYHVSSGFTTYNTATTSTDIYSHLPVSSMRIYPTISYSNANVNNFLVVSGTNIPITGLSLHDLYSGLIRLYVLFSGTIPSYTSYSALIIGLTLDSEIYL